MELGIRGRTAVVTGASRGIGAAVAEQLEAEGARVVRVSRTDGIDVTSPDAAERIAERVGGHVDILVNNAGTAEIKPLDELRDEDWYASHELNVMAPMRLMRHFAPPMATRRWGRIVNVASTAGKRPSGTWPAYSLGKTAQLSLSRAFADRYAPDGVLVNAIAPGPVGSPMWLADGGLADQLARRQGISKEEVLRGQHARVPMGRLGEEAEVAAVVVFLCSEAASWVAGASWSVDGGTLQSFL
jgi:3-oxoacyl-[acyl-carrier protein] reductase